eukprot:TRINITY_DN5670_c0_g1_i7.p1 TRINITY_DN5670_c0_g1~~TRINITY_DN5670_c0_g1_i7.p1  ORF type:complete len:678 (-),score=122.50 TRINITY_DN5670_c0_g1_i7:107-2140(-)
MQQDIQPRCNRFQFRGIDVHNDGTRSSVIHLLKLLPGGKLKIRSTYSSVSSGHRTFKAEGTWNETQLFWKVNKEHKGHVHEVVYTISFSGSRKVTGNFKCNGQSGQLHYTSGEVTPSEKFQFEGEDVESDGTVQPIKGEITISPNGGVRIIYHATSASSETVKGRLLKRNISWTYSGKKYSGKVTGSNPLLPDSVTGIFEKEGGQGRFTYIVSYALEAAENDEASLDELSKVKSDATKKEVVRDIKYGQQYLSIISACKASGTKWNDPDFKPISSSIGNVKVKGEDPEWRRASEIWSNPKLFSDGISPHDIKQGSLGNCYFLAALSVLAEYPEFITKLFTCEDNDYGVYSMTFYPQGLRTEVVVDDWLPCYKGSPCFSKTYEEELWVLLLEKAYAKCYGSYKDIATGFAHQAMFDLTGAHHQYFTFGAAYTPEKVFERLVAADSAKHMMLAATPGKDSGLFETASTGLCAGHAYGILDARVFEGNKLLHIRNPWGHVEWTGAWGDKDSRWTPEAKAALPWSDVNDGTYWMCLEDFTKYFRSVTICYTGIPTNRLSTGLRIAPGCVKTLEVQITGKGRLRMSFCQGRMMSPNTLSTGLSIKSGDQYLTKQPVEFQYSYNIFSSEVLVETGTYELIVECTDDKKSPSYGYLSVHVSPNLSVKMKGGNFGKFIYKKPGEV